MLRNAFRGVSLYRFSKYYETIYETYILLIYKRLAYRFEIML